jgi:ribosomal protein L7/L12
MSKFQVRVSSLPSEGVPLVKALRTIADLGLADAKGLFDYLREHTPCVVVAGIAREVADHVAELLEEAGADAAVEESTLDVPMLLCPEVDHRHRWSWLGGPTRIK